MAIYPYPRTPCRTLLQSSCALAVAPRHTAACFHSSIPCVRKFLKNANYRFCQKAKTRQSNKKKKMVWACATYTRTCNYYIITPPLDRVSPNRNEQTTMLFNPPQYSVYSTSCDCNIWFASCKERSYRILFAIAPLPFARALKKPGNVLGALSSMYDRTSARIFDFDRFCPFCGKFGRM